MKPRQQTWLSSLPLPPTHLRPGEAQQPRAWNWHLEPELWARSLRQQLDAQLRLDSEERRVGSSPVEALESWYSVCVLDSKGQPGTCQSKQGQFLKAVAESEQPSALELLLAELETLFAAVLQDSSPAAWRYLHAVLGLLPPYRELLVGHLDLLPFLEQLSCWAPWVQSQLHLDLLDAMDKAFPPDISLLDTASHADCHPQKQKFGRVPPCPACPFVQTWLAGQQVKELATWLRPLTLPEFQRCLGIVGAEVALEETQWLDGLSLLPLALATDIPVQYESSDADNADKGPDERRKTRAIPDYAVHGEKAFQSKSSGLLPETSFLSNRLTAVLKTDRYLKKIHFLYLNVAPSRHFRPYSLVVVPPDKVNPEHYIFSPFGILHVHPVEGSETMTLGTWHRHSVLWQQLQSIPFFKYCLLRKALTWWKRSVGFQGLQRLQIFLENHLLLAVPHFGAGLLHINRLLQELRSVPWLPQEPDRCYELLDLRRALATENYKALQRLRHCLKLCTSILQLIHEDTYHMQQGLQERVQNCNRIRTGQGSIYLQRVLRQQLEQKLKLAEAWLMQLGKLARLVHYMICQNLVSILEEEITSFVANILQAPRQKPFLLSQLVFDSCGQLSPVPCIENMIQVITGALQTIQTSALQVVKSTELKTSWDSLYSEEEEEEGSDTEPLKPKFLGQPSDAVRIFCGPNVGLVWPWKTHLVTDTLEVRGYRLRGQYLPPNFKHLQEDLDNSPQIQQALTTQQALLEDMLQEVQEFCKEHGWVTGIYEFLQSWGPQKSENMRGCPIKDYVNLVSCLNVWQARVSKMPVELLTKGKVLLLSCRDVQTEMESRLDSIRKDILAQVQDECCSRSQQLMTQFTDFMQVFQTINSDIHAIAQCSQKLNEANEQYTKLEERVEYVRSLHELIRNHFGIFTAENEALDIALLDVWEAFQFEKSQASEFLLSKRHAIVPKLQQLMVAALTELESLLEKTVSGPFMDPTQEQRSTERQLLSLELQFQNTVGHLKELHHTYTTFTGLNVLDLGLNMKILEEQMLHEIVYRERPGLETRWQDLKIGTIDTCEAMEIAEERLLTMLLFKNQKQLQPSKFLRHLVRAQAGLCQLRAHFEELEEQRLQEVALWEPYQCVVQHGMAMIKALSPLQNLLPFFRMGPENWLTATKQALDSMNPNEMQHGEDLASHLLQLRTHLTRQLLGSAVAMVGLTHVRLVGALGALALLQVTKKASELEILAFWPGLAASPSIGHGKLVPDVARPAWLGPRAWHECGLLELLPPFAGLRASLAGHSSVWQAYLSLSSTVLGPAPGPGPGPLSLLQKLILWRVLRPECLAGALADFTTSLLGRPLEENLGAHTIPFEHSQAIRPMLILLPPAGHPTAILHPLTVIQKLAATHEQGQKHLQVIALGSEAWDPVSAVVSRLHQAMHKGHWLVLDNCHLMPHWPKELLQPLLGLSDGAQDLELELLSVQPERNRITVHRDFRLWLIVSAEASASLPAVLTQRAMPVFWDQSLDLGHVLIDSVELAQQGLHMQPSTQTLPLVLLHSLLLHRQLYGIRLQAHRGRWSQATLTQVLQTQGQLWASLSNPSVAMQELTASVFYGAPVGDVNDREALISLVKACLSPRSGSGVQPHTPRHLLATLMPSPELGEPDAIAECKAQMRLLPTPSEPRMCGLSEGPQTWLLRLQSRALLSALQRSLPRWVPAAREAERRTEKRLRQRLAQALRRLESLQALLTDATRQEEYTTPAQPAALGPHTRRPLEAFLESEALELRQLVGLLQRDLRCLWQQLKGGPPCASRRCVAVAHALWTGLLPPPWRLHAPASLQPPWHWLGQLSRRGQLLVRYLAVGVDARTNAPERVFHLSAFCHPRRLLLALRWEAALHQYVPSPNVSGSRGLGSSQLPHKRQELNGSPLHLRVENDPNPTIPEMGLLLIGLQVLHAEWDPIAGALQDNPSSQPSPLPPVSVSARAPVASDLPHSAGLAVYSCPVYMAGPLGTTKLHSRNILMHLPLPTKLSPATCVQRRVHVCSPPLI
ncbi:Dynein heavy chain domain-containing protein 1 [Tupaia chinensis]|uniref:Dynein heavy chain domain-containing protein 1 n=1 Tax=Tupaia chinensis TaxID=246437 RepID=L8YH73_TUPCH|nr:Dynein heavy chain domain-containing protein 1 [Tupaia chinensis]